MKSLKRFLFGYLFVISGLLVGCKPPETSDINASSSFPTHRYVKQPPALTRGNSLLFVSLEAFLGRISQEQSTAPELRLRSVGKPLVLRDAKGVVHKSVAITLIWRNVPLLHKKQLARQVVGPFASYESAQRSALNLKRMGLPAVVAYPKEWEVWLPIGVTLPEGTKVISWETTVSSEIQPFLKGDNGGRIALAGPIKIEAPQGLKWKGGVYEGPFVIQPDAYGSWTLVEQVPLERYLLGVVPHEIGGGSPSVALEVQAVLARTWALANSNRFAIDGFHLCSNTQCQVYSDPSEASDEVKRAISTTFGKVLSWQGLPINAVYHASNGGVMADGTESWAMDPVPYLRAQLDGPNQWRNRFRLPLRRSSSVQVLLNDVDGAYGKNHARFRWERILTAQELTSFLAAQEINLQSPKNVHVLERGTSGRVLALEISDLGNNSRVVLRLDQIRRTLRTLPSTLFVVNQLDDLTWKFSGGGFGHGSGLSQAGAIDLARRGWSTEQILRHYYPGTIYGPLPDFWKAP